MLGAVLNAKNELATGDNLKQSFDPDTIREVCSEGFIRNLVTVLEALIITSEPIEPDPSLSMQMRSLKNELEQGTCDKREGILAARLKTIVDSFQENLNLRRFMFLPSDQAPYYREFPLTFGPPALTSLPKAALVEIAEAGKCYACGRWTACVFHCMRISEYGLRRLFRISGAKRPVKGIKTPAPKQVSYAIEYGTWNDVIGAIKSKISKARNLPPGQKKERRLQFFSDAADHCEYIKDIWRNEISHTRRTYRKPETLAVIQRVREFTILVTGGAPK